MIDAIFVPRGVEERAVRRGLGRRSAGIALYATAPGAGAAAAVDTLLKERGTPRRVLITGLCASLDPAFVPGDALIYASLERAGAEPLETDRVLGAEIQAKVPSAQSGVRGLSVDRVVTRASEKRGLAASSGAQAIDMESYALAARLHTAGIAFAVLRCVSDAGDRDLPDLGRAFGPEGLDRRALSKAIISKPIAGVHLIAGGLRGLRSLRRVFDGLPA